MIQKQEKTVITFFTTTEAMHMEDICKGCGAKGRLIPLPSFISAGCGLAWCADLQEEENLKAVMEQSGIVYQGIHRCKI